MLVPSAVGLTTLNAAPARKAKSGKLTNAQAISAVTSLAKYIPYNLETLNKEAFTPDFYKMLVEAYEMPITDLMEFVDGAEYGSWFGGNGAGPDFTIKDVRIFYNGPTEIFASFKLVEDQYYPEEHHITIVKNKAGKWVIADIDLRYNNMVTYLNEANEAFRNGWADKVVSQLQKEGYDEYISEYRQEVNRYLGKYGSRAPYTHRQFKSDSDKVMADLAASQEVTEIVIVAPEEVMEEIFDAEAGGNSTASTQATARPAQKVDADKIYTTVEQEAVFPGGMNAFGKWLGSNLKYPEYARENDIQGRVVVRFVVNTDGSVGDITVVKGVEKSLDQEAVRVVSKMPKWQPAMNKGVAVRSYVTLPIGFKL